MKLAPHQRRQLPPNEFAPIAGRGGRQEGQSDVEGAFSINVFPDLPQLQYSHADAEGWLDYLEQFYPPNFWFRDKSVQAWAYYPDTDDYSGIYGMDAVLAAYHSGHGGGTGEGYFVAAMGSAWDDEPAEAHSDRMRLGDERANYLFWSTCDSLPALNGGDPIRTWSLANQGFRMLFGNSTPTIDDPNYGKFFWQEWVKGKSLALAWLDSGWRVSPYQSPAALAVGATKEEANDRFNNENRFYWEHVQPEYWVWGWYPPLEASEEAVAVAVKGLVGDLEPIRGSAQRLDEVLPRLGFSGRRAGASAPNGVTVVVEGEMRAAVEPTGAWEAFFPSRSDGRGRPAERPEVTAAARRFVAEHGLDPDAELTLLGHRSLRKASAARNGEATRREDGEPLETTVIFGQVIDGTPVVSADAGRLHVTVDGKGSVIRVRDTRRRVVELHKRYRQTVPPPRGSSGAPADPMRLLEQAVWDETTRRWGGRGQVIPHTKIIAGSVAVGYLFEGNEAYLGAACDVEAAFDGGFSKRFRVTVPIYR